MQNLLKTPLYSRHVLLNAKMVPFAGYLMPVSYKGINHEHRLIRTSAALFDVAHMGMFSIKGAGALKYLQNLTVNNVANLGDMQSQYSALCYENGTVVDDIFVYRIHAEEFRMVVNASNITKDFAWANSQLISDVELTNLSPELGIIAIQGPSAVAAAQFAFRDCHLEALAQFSCIWLNFEGLQILVSRTGYTGEDGLEFYVPNNVLGSLWDYLLQKGVGFGLEPAGLGSRDTARLEAGYSLYGHELNDQTPLLESGLHWVVDFNKPDFIGKAALVKIKNAGLQRKIMGLELIDKAIPREGCEVFLNQIPVGVVTSGTISPLTSKGIALAFLNTALCKSGQEVEINIRGVLKKAKIVSRYFYRRKVS
jgi:aminomethyltransferase